MDLQLTVQSVPNTTNIVSSNPAHGEVYSIDHYVIKFVSNLLQVGGIFLLLWFPPPKNIPVRYNWNIVESVIKHYNLNSLNKWLWLL
jgi:hypothetical protein